MICPLCEKGTLVFRVGRRQLSKETTLHQEELLMIECQTDAFGIGLLLGIKSECVIPTGSDLFNTLEAIYRHDTRVETHLVDLERDYANRRAVYLADSRAERNKLEGIVKQLAAAKKENSS